MKQSADYWDYATLLELAILDNNEKKANASLFDVLENIREDFEPKTTANNISMIRKNKEFQGLDCDWIKSIEKRLLSV